MVNRMRGGCIWYKFSGQNCTAVLIFYPWKKDSGCFPSRSYRSTGRIPDQRHPEKRSIQLWLLPLIHSSTLCCRFFPTATSWCLSQLSYTVLLKPLFPQHLFFFYSSHSLVKWSPLLALQHHLIYAYLIPAAQNQERCSFASEFNWLLYHISSFFGHAP